MTALDIIETALRRINSYQHGETIAQPDVDDCLETLNDLLDSWSTDKLQIFGSNENVLQWINGQNQYRVGNPTNLELGEPNFTAVVTGGSNLITATNIPSDLVAGNAPPGPSAGSTLTDAADVFPAGTYCTGISGSTITMSAPATITPSQNPDLISYTVPGDFAIPRPLRITGGYTRINQLDFWLDVYASQDEYNAILYKPQPGPWPTIAWYNPLMPYGILNVYQTPGQAAQLHLFTDTILSNLTVNQTFILPQGYSRALKWNLAQELWAEYCAPAPLPPTIKKMAFDSMAVVKALNAQPPQRAKYDRALVRGNRADGGWITHGGFGYG
jgi:hypothetical protein